MTKRWAVFLALFVMAGTLSPATSHAADPKVPAGRDPGGIAVAIIGGGVDYRRPELVDRLARDGEGELIGWDFVDEDRRPFAQAGPTDRLATTIVASGLVRIAPMRISRGDERQVARALRLLDETPARIALLAADLDTPIGRSNLVAAAQSLPRLLIVVPARLVTPPRLGAGGNAEDVAGLLVVSARPATFADVWLAADGVVPASEVPEDDLAAARVVALAARVAAGDPGLTGAALRAKLLALAVSATGGPTFRQIEELR